MKGSLAGLRFSPALSSLVDDFKERIAFGRLAAGDLNLLPKPLISLDEDIDFKKEPRNLMSLRGLLFDVLVSLAGFVQGPTKQTQRTVV